MYGQPNSSLYFSSNAVVSGDGAMARRKGVLTTQVVMVVVVAALVGLLLGGRIFLTNQITSMRARVADLENQKEFLEAGSAKLHMNWNHASSGEVVVARAQKELGLIVPEKPGLVLVCLDGPKKDKNVLRDLWAGLPASDQAGELVAGAMVSLVPRGALAGTMEGGSE